MNAHDLIKKSKLVTSFFSLFQKGMGNLRFEAIHNFQYRSMQQFFGQMPLLKTEVDRWQKQEQTVLFLVSDQERQEKLTQEFHDVEIKAVQNTPDQLLIGQTQIVTGSLTNGFELPQDKLVVVTEREKSQKSGLEDRQSPMQNA